MQLGDARQGKLADNIVGFGRALRRAGVNADSERIALAQQAALQVGLQSKADVSAALECVLVSREQDRGVFRELFEVYFKDPDVAAKLLSQMLPTSQGKAEPSKRRPRVREALAPHKAFGQHSSKPQPDKEIDFDAAMTASDLQQLKHADFNALTASEYRLVEILARDLALPVPCIAGRRLQPSARGARLHWRSALQQAARTGGELMQLPLVLLVDVSGSMERYARMMLSFLHAATRSAPVWGRPRIQRDVFAVGTQLTNLSAAFRLGDGDEMLATASGAIEDFAGGTKLADCLAQLREQHSRRLVGGRSIVLLVSDGLDTGDGAQLDQELAWLKRHCRRLLWLNPLLRFEGYAPLARGAQALHRHSDAMLAVHNLQKLQDLAHSLHDIFNS
jgi:uncharacterized protein